VIARTDEPSYFFQGDNVIGRQPAGQAGTAIIYYYPIGTELTNDTDELPLRFRAYTKSFVDYCRSQEAFRDNRLEEGELQERKAQAQREIYAIHAQSRDKSDTHMISLEDEYVVY